METFDALAGRASVRDYISKPVPQDMLEKLVDAGRRAPTARAVEPWEFVVVTEGATLRKLAETTDHGRFIAAAPACVVVLSQSTKYYLEDGSAATQNILLAACARGLGACWVAGDKKRSKISIADFNIYHHSVYWGCDRISPILQSFTRTLPMASRSHFCFCLLHCICNQDSESMGQGSGAETWSFSWLKGPGIVFHHPNYR